MPWQRWIFLLIAAWSTCTVWAEDPLARTPKGPHWQLYWTLIAIIACVALVSELRDFFQKAAERKAD